MQGTPRSHCGLPKVLTKPHLHSCNTPVAVHTSSYSVHQCLGDCVCVCVFKQFYKMMTKDPALYNHVWVEFCEKTCLTVVAVHTSAVAPPCLASQSQLDCRLVLK